MAAVGAERPKLAGVRVRVFYIHPPGRTMQATKFGGLRTWS